MRSTAVAFIVLMTTAGCLGESTTLPDEVLSTAAVGPTHRIQDTVRMGWVVGVGKHDPFADLVVGVRNYDQCPEAWFPVPAGASDLEIHVPAANGIGPYQVVISNPEAIYFPMQRLAGEPFDYDNEEPPAGLWTVEFVPFGATVNQVWDVEVAFTATEPLDGIAFQLDGRCLH